VQTGNDALLMAESKEELKNRIMLTYNFDVPDNFISKITYRPFDKRYYFFLKSRAINPTPIQIPLSYRSRFEVMKNFKNENYGLVISRQWRNSDSNQTWSNCFCVQDQAELALFLSANAGANIFPLYKYVQEVEFTKNQAVEKVSNFNSAIIEQIENQLNLSFSIDNSTNESTFSSLNLLDYIYAVLHSPKYSANFKEFLKTDFPRVPYPNNKVIFWKLVQLGKEIREIHLLQSAILDNFINQFPVTGNNLVDKKASYEDGKVWINKNQYFDNVPLVAWEFFVGGYQPAQKWLKDRKGRMLTEEDINHYQKIIVALSETDRIMTEINKIDFMQSDASRIHEDYPNYENDSDDIFNMAAEP
jgi:predicted helicase